MDRWTAYFMAIAQVNAEMSKDCTKIGAVLVGEQKQVIATGFNGFPRLVDDDIPARHERPAKYKFTEHAERNALDHAALTGVSSLGSTLYTTAPPCSDCTKGIIQCGVIGIVTLIDHILLNRPSWEEDFNEFALPMLRDANIRIKWV